MAVDASMPAAFRGLFEPHRYKVFYGGRGGGKSRAFARALLLTGVQRPGVCCVPARCRTPSGIA